MPDTLSLDPARSTFVTASFIAKPATYNGVLSLSNESSNCCENNSNKGDDSKRYVLTDQGRRAIGLEP